MLGPNLGDAHTLWLISMCVFSLWEIGSGQKMSNLFQCVVQDPGRQVSHILFDGVLLLDQGLPLGPMSTSWWHFRNIRREREFMHINMTDCVSHIWHVFAHAFLDHIWIISWGPFRSWVCTKKLLWCATGCCLHWLRNYLALASQNLGNCLLSWAGSEDERVLVETPEALLLQDFKAFWAFGAVGSPWLSVTCCMGRLFLVLQGLEKNLGNVNYSHSIMGRVCVRAHSLWWWQHMPPFV